MTVKVVMRTRYVKLKIFKYASLWLCALTFLKPAWHVYKQIFWSMQSFIILSRMETKVMKTRMVKAGYVLNLIFLTLNVSCARLLSKYRFKSRAEHKLTPNTNCNIGVMERLCSLPSFLKEGFGEAPDNGGDEDEDEVSFAAHLSGAVVHAESQYF